MNRFFGHHPGLRIVLAYVMTAGLWIVLSDRALGWLGYGPAEIGRLQTAKGIAFVLVTAGLLAALLDRDDRERRRSDAARRRGEEQLRKALEQAGARAQEMHALLESVPAAVLVAHDSFCARVTGNREAARLFHPAPAEAEHAASAPVPLENLRLRRDGKELRAAEFPLRVAAADGREVRDFEADLLVADRPPRRILGYAAPLRHGDGSTRGAVAAFLDITDRVAAEARLRDQASLLDSARDAMAVHDLEGRVLFWNASAARLYGVPPAEAAQRRVQDLFFRGEEPPPGVRQSLFERGEWSGELNQLSATGEAFTVEARWTLLRDASGDPAKVFCIHTDVTDRKRLESQFLRAQRLESIGHLASGIAHDLNNVLAPVMMAVGIFREKLTDPESQGLLDAVSSSVQRGSDLLRQILLLSRGLKGRRAPLLLGTMLRELQKFTLETFPRTITTEVDCAPDLWPVPADPSQLHQVLLNLCVNARDAMPRGGRLQLRARNRMISGTDAAALPGLEPGPHVQLEVEDEGTGIPPDILPRVFDPFFTTKEEGKGTGLGLTTVASIIRAHRGALDVDTQPGRGTRFVVLLPAVPDAEAGETAARAAPAAGRGECVLIVDDEQAVLRVTRHTLLKNGYQVLAAEGGAQALELLAARRGAIDLLLTDIMMPGIDGWTLIRQARQLNRGLRVLAMTGFQENTTDDPESRPHEVLAKPFTTEELLEAVQRVLGRSRRDPRAPS